MRYGASLGASNNSTIFYNIPEYAKDYKREYIFIRGINKDFMYFIKKFAKLNQRIFQSKIADRMKYNMERFLRGQEKGKLKDISDLRLQKDDYCFIEEFYFCFDDIIDLEFLEMVGKIYNKIKIVMLFSDVYGEGFCI